MLHHQMNHGQRRLHLMYPLIHEMAMTVDLALLLADFLQIKAVLRFQQPLQGVGQRRAWFNVGKSAQRIRDFL
ncbi:hypothetical protein D3C81_1414490 [compost metagenome]